MPEILTNLTLKNFVNCSHVLFLIFTFPFLHSNYCQDAIILTFSNLLLVVFSVNVLM